MAAGSGVWMDLNTASGRSRLTVIAPAPPPIPAPTAPTADGRRLARLLLGARLPSESGGAIAYRTVHTATTAAD